MQIRLARERNFKIFQLRGILGRLSRLVPKDVKEHFTNEELHEWYRMNSKISETLDTVKKSTNCLCCYKRRKVNEEGLCNECGMEQ